MASPLRVIGAGPHRKNRREAVEKGSIAFGNGGANIVGEVSSQIKPCSAQDSPHQRKWFPRASTPTRSNGITASPARRCWR
jgi:hypothetical protein